MPLAARQLLAARIGVTAFFGTGVAIAAAVAFNVVQRGGSVGAGVAFGACYGGFGAWAVFYSTYHLSKAIKRIWRSAGA